MESKPPNENEEDKAKPTNGEEAPAAETTAPKPEGESPEKKLLYLQAEFENFRKRLIRDQEVSVRFANERLIRDLLPIVNHFDRALAAAAPIKSGNNTELQNFLLGIEMTHRELVLTLERFGVEWIGKKGEKFSPERHEAVSQLESPGAEPDSVVEVLERGCLLQGRLLQPAKVVVAKA